MADTPSRPPNRPVPQPRTSVKQKKCPDIKSGESSEQPVPENKHVNIMNRDTRERHLIPMPNRPDQRQKAVSPMGRRSFPAHPHSSPILSSRRNKSDGGSNNYGTGDSYQSPVSFCLSLYHSFMKLMLWLNER